MATKGRPAPYGSILRVLRGKSSVGTPQRLNSLRKLQYFLDEAFRVPGTTLRFGRDPIVGDVADAFWKSNTMNFALLERHAAEAQPATSGDWVFVGVIITVIVALALIPLLVVYLLYHLLFIHSRE